MAIHHFRGRNPPSAPRRWHRCTKQQSCPQISSSDCVKVEEKHRDQERRDELEFIENGPHYIGFDRDAAVEEFKRKWVR